MSLLGEEIRRVRGSKTAVPRAAVIARSARLTESQKRFRASRAGGVLESALPECLWRESKFVLRHGEKARPVARQDGVCWYDAEQVEPAGLSPKNSARLVQGGDMGGARSRR